MSTLRDRIGSGSCLLLDGGFGTELLARGLRPGEPPDRWTLDHPDVIREVHRRYVEAGSEAVHANTFGANRTRLRSCGLEDRCAELNRSAVDLARASGATFVLADIGPTGEYLPPVGGADVREWREAFEEQIRAIVETDADGLHIETMMDLREAIVALDAAVRCAPHLPVLVSLTFERKKRGFFTVMGDPLGPSLTRLRDAGAVVAGANCTLPSADMRVLAEEARALGVPLVIQPNAGQPRLDEGGAVYDQAPDEFAADMAGVAPYAAAVGGCCGTDPRFIAALRSAMDRGGGVRSTP